MKKAALTTLQIAVTLAILYFIFRDPGKRAEMGQAVVNANPLWLLLGFFVYGGVEFCAALRWRVLLDVQGIVLGWTRLFALVMIGLFFNFFIPGGTGGDMVKVFYLLKETPGQRSNALLSVVVDRLIGLLSLILLAVGFVAAYWSWLTSTPATARYVWIVFLLLGLCSAALIFSIVVTAFGWVHRLPAKMPGRDRLAELALGYGIFGRAWRSSLCSLGYSILVHLGYFLTYFCAAKAYASGDTRVPTLGEFFAIAPVVDTIVAMPISLGGIGVREGLFQVFLGELCQVAGGVAVVISSTGYLLTFCWGLVGAVIYMFYRPSEHARLREMRRAVEAMEHSVAESEMAMEVAQEGEPRP